MRGLGHIADDLETVVQDLREHHVGVLLGAAAGELPTIVDYSSMLERIPDQGGTNSCVGQAFATAIFLRAHLDGIPLPRPSAKAIYDVARLIETPNVLIDIGSRPRLAVEGLQDYGMVADDRWPLTESNVNTPPPLDVFRAGLGAKLAAHYRIGGADVATLLRSALARGFVPVFAMDVDDAYLAYDGSAIYAGLTALRVGSHMQAVVGYGAEYFLVANSWGPGWGQRGFARVAPDFFNTSAVRDVIVPTVIPARLT